MGWLDLLAVQGTLKSLLQHHNSKASILWRLAFFVVQLSHPYMTTGKTIALARWTFVGKVTSLVFKTLSSFSPEGQASFNFMAAVTVRSRLGAQGDKACHASVMASLLSSSVSREVMGPDATILVFLNVVF